MSAVSRTTSLTPENKNRTTRCEAVKDKYPANGAADPECRANRCPNKTELKAEFTPLKVGGCSTKDLRKTDDGYVFQKVCGGAAPIKTEINVKGDSAYTEIHQGSIGRIPTKETVAAQRVGDCRPPT